MRGLRLRAFLFLLAAASTCGNALADDGLRVDRPLEVAFSISRMTRDAAAMGLTDSGFAVLLSSSLTRAGLSARRSDSENDDTVLFLDIVVEDEAFYVSLDFLRPASFRLPGGEMNSEPVSVWQGYSVGTHKDDAGKIRDTVSQIVEQFVTSYRDANDLSIPARVAQWQ